MQYEVTHYIAERITVSADDESQAVERAKSEPRDAFTVVASSWTAEESQ